MNFPLSFKFANFLSEDKIMARRKPTQLELSEKRERSLQLYEQLEIGMIARTKCGRTGIITEKFLSIGGMPHVWMQEFMSSVPTPEPTEFIVEIMPTSSPLPISLPLPIPIMQGSIDEKLPCESDPSPFLLPKPTLILPSKPTLIELFAGGGGVAAGAIDAGIEPIIAVELDPSKPELSSAIADCHEQNFPNCQVIRQTVQDVASLGFSGFPTEPNILVATPVCSSFSPAKNGTEQPEDIAAAKAVAAAIKALKPRHFLLENVPAYQNSQSWLLIESQLYLLGYRVAASVVDMSDYGIPQARKRLIVRAAQDDRDPIPLPPLQPKVGWYDAIADLIPNLPDSSLLPGQQKSLDQYLRNNEPTPLLIDRVGGRGEYRLVPADKPSKTILRSHFTDGNGRNRNKFADIRLPDGTVKSLSIECIRRLQGFPDWYKFPNSVAVAGSILGYAVPPKFIEMLLKNLTVASDSETATPNNQLHQPTNSINQLIPLTVDSNSEKVISHEPTAISQELITNNGQKSTTNDLKPEVINLPITNDLKPEVISQNPPTPNSQEWLNISEIHRDGGTQPRAFLDLKHVATLVEVLEDGGELDPVTVFYDGTEYWLADGFHRCKAHEDFGQEEINCVVTQGIRRDAVLYSVGANAEHKAVKPRSREDKRRAVTMLLHDPEWKEWSNYKIAEVCKVSDEFVRRLRNNLTTNVGSEEKSILTTNVGSEEKSILTTNVGSEEESTRTYTTKHGTKSRMRTGKIGRTPGEQGGRGAGRQGSRGENNNNTTVPHSLLPTPNSELQTPSSPPIEEYLIGFISRIDEMSIPLVEEAQRHIDRRLKRQSDVNELNAQLKAIAVERDQFKTEVEAIAVERDQFKTEVELRESRIEALLQEIEQLKTRPTRQSSREVFPEQVQEVMV